MLSAQIEMEEKREVLANERRLREQGSTLSQFAQSEAAEARGRFTAHEQSTVVGASSVPKYPAAYLQHDPVPTEPSLGVDINEMEPTGQPHELRASIASLEPSVSSAQATPSASGAQAGAEGFSSRTYRRA